jgi:predicted nucleic acid-binding protein
MTILIDTSFLVAAGAVRDKNHALARQTMRNLTGIRVVPAPVLPEMFYLLSARVDFRAAVKMFDLVRTGQFQIVDLTAEDMARMKAIMDDYEDNAFDYVDNHGAGRTPERRRNLHL